MKRLRRELARSNEDNVILAKAAVWFRQGDDEDPKRVYEFIKVNRAEPRTTTLSRVMRVSRDGYYGWVRRLRNGPSRRGAQDLSGKIKDSVQGTIRSWW